MIEKKIQILKEKAILRKKMGGLGLQIQQGNLQGNCDILWEN